MTSLTRSLGLDRVKFPAAPSRRLLAYLHSGDVLRQALPWIMRVWAIVSFVLFAAAWLSAWPGIYREFERWGLVKAFLAQLIMFAAIFLVIRITMLRAEHLRVLPPDDFVNLRALAIVCRWAGEVTLVYCVGDGLSSLLEPVGPLLTSAVNAFAPAAGQRVSSGSASVLLVSSPFTMLYVWFAAALFLGTYALATAIDVYLAIEFNTRASRAGRGGPA